MELKTMHPRLHAFYASKTLNILMILIIDALLLMACFTPAALPAICGAAAMLAAIIYSLVFWIKKPKSIVVNSRLSDISTLFTLYFLAIVALKCEYIAWYIIPVALSAIILIAAFSRRFDSRAELP